MQPAAGGEDTGNGRRARQVRAPRHRPERGQLAPAGYAHRGADGGHRPRRLRGQLLRLQRRAHCPPPRPRPAHQPPRRRHVLPPGLPLLRRRQPLPRLFRRVHPRRQVRRPRQPPRQSHQPGPALRRRCALLPRRPASPTRLRRRRRAVIYNIIHYMNAIPPCVTALMSFFFLVFLCCVGRFFLVAWDMN